MPTQTISPTAVATAVLDQLAEAWNRADGEAIGRLFAAETDFVDIRGVHHRGPTAIAAGHQAILDTIYLGSRVAYEVDLARELAPGCFVAVSTSTLDAPSGPLQGINHSRLTTVFVEEDGRWAITAFHNTLIRQ